MFATLSREHTRVSNRDTQVRPRRSLEATPSGRQGHLVTSREPRGRPGRAGRWRRRRGGRQAPRRQPARVPPVAPGSSAERGRGPVVAVTGAASGLGHALTTRLAASDRVGRVVAIDGHRGDATGVTWRVVDVRDPALAGRLAGVDVVVHLDLDLAPDSDHRSRRAFNVRGAQTVLTAAAAGPGRPGGAGHQRDGLRRAAGQPGAAGRGRAAGRRLGRQRGRRPAGDRAARASARPQANPGMAVTVVRPAALVGEGVDTVVTRHFEAPRLLAVKGCAPRWQFCHVDDLVSALELAAAGEVTGEVRGRLRRLARAGAGGGAVRAAAD